MNALAAVLLLTLAGPSSVESQLRDGDIIFHESRSSQSRAIQLATSSRYSHMGIVTARTDAGLFTKPYSR